MINHKINIEQRNSILFIVVGRIQSRYILISNGMRNIDKAIEDLKYIIENKLN